MFQNHNLEEHLQKYFGYHAFRTGQREIIEDVLQGNDCLGVLPTGTGKSVCYQLPARLLPGTAIVVSPLISLMIDQVKQLKANGFKQAVAINSFMTYTERKAVYRKLADYKLIYVSPEILQQEDLMTLLKQLVINLFVVDEAHCISQWGHEFRPDYLKLQETVQKLNNPPILALSATATSNVQKDILTFLNRPNMIKHVYPMDKPNIIFSIKEVENDTEKIDVLCHLFQKNPVPALIYFSSRTTTEAICQTLLYKLPKQRIAFYHGGMEQTDRLQIQQQFMNNQLDIICCTNAFGLGINKQNIRLVVHFHLPSQLESYIQETGRAGRDNQPSVGLLLYSKHDVYLPSHLIKKELPTDIQLKNVFHKLYRIHENNEAMPSNQQQIETDFQVTEIQWRFLYYQFEKHGMIVNNTIVYNREHWQNAFEQLKRFIEKRKWIKENKLAEIVNWIHSEDCLRRSLYQPFQNTIQTPDGPCCSNCGFRFENWSPHYTPAVHNRSGTWQEKLHSLLLGTEENAGTDKY